MEQIPIFHTIILNNIGLRIDNFDRPVLKRIPVDDPCMTNLFFRIRR